MNQLSILQNLLPAGFIVQKAINPNTLRLRVLVPTSEAQETWSKLRAEIYEARERFMDETNAYVYEPSTTTYSFEDGHSIVTFQIAIR